MPSEVRPFAPLRVTAWPGVILSGAKNLGGAKNVGGDVGKMARAWPEKSEGMRRQILEALRRGAESGDQEGSVDGVQIAHEVGQKGIVAGECQALYPEAVILA